MSTAKAGHAEGSKKLDHPKTGESSASKKVTRKIQALAAIQSFILDLADTFVKSKPLKLYHRLIIKITASDEEAVGKVVAGFKQFFSTYDSEILENKLSTIPVESMILYGTNDHIAIEIGRYIASSSSDKETLDVIRRHLLTIKAIVDPSDKNLKTLEKAEKAAPKPKTEEEAILDKLKSQIKTRVEAKGDEVKDGAGVSDIVGTVMGGGGMADMFKTLDSGLAGGKANPKRLMSLIQRQMMQMMSQMDDDDGEAGEEESTGEDKEPADDEKPTGDGEQANSIEEGRRDVKCEEPVSVTEDETHEDTLVVVVEHEVHEEGILQLTKRSSFDDELD